MSSFKGKRRKPIRPKVNYPYDIVMHDDSISAGARILWLIMAARGTARDEDQILKDFDYLMDLFVEAYNEIIKQ